MSKPVMLEDAFSDLPKSPAERDNGAAPDAGATRQAHSAYGLESPTSTTHSTVSRPTLTANNGAATDAGIREDRDAQTPDVTAGHSQGVGTSVSRPTLWFLICLLFPLAIAWPAQTLELIAVGSFFGFFGWLLWMATETGMKAKRKAREENRQ